MAKIEFTPNPGYPRIKIPLSRPFKEISSKEAGEFFGWFMENRSKRIDVLEHYVNLESGLWKADFTRRSLSDLGTWLLLTARCRTLSAEEKGAEIADQKHPEWFADLVRGLDKDLSVETYSRCFDAGIYFGETLRKEVSLLKWTYKNSPKSYIDLHQPVIERMDSKHGDALNPISIVEVVARKMIQQKVGAEELLRIYGIWRNLFMSEAA